MIAVDRSRGVVVVKRGSTVDGSIRFDGRVVVGRGAIVLGRLEAEEVATSAGCVLRVIKCSRAVIGARSHFEEIDAGEVLLLRGCRGGRVRAKKVRVSNGCTIGEIIADEIVIEGEAKVGRMEGRRIVATSEA